MKAQFEKFQFVEVENFLKKAENQPAPPAQRVNCNALVVLVVFLAAEISVKTLVVMWSGLLLVVIAYFFIRAYVRERNYRRRNAKYFS